MTAPTPTPAAPVRWATLWPIWAGMTIAGSAAVVASAYTLAALATAAGWAAWTPWLLPASLDVGGAVGGWCWLRPGAPDRARQFGRGLALTGAAGTLVGNAVGHLVSSGYLQPGPVLVVVVGAVPAAMLVALAHLAALLIASTADAAGPAVDVPAPARDAVAVSVNARPAHVTESASDVNARRELAPPAPDPAPAPAAGQSGPARRTDDAEVIAAARVVVARLEKSGDAVTWDSVKAGLSGDGFRIGGTRLGRVMRALRDEPGADVRDETERVA